jgi:glucose/arabinose dehydrogenase
MLSRRLRSVTFVGVLLLLWSVPVTPGGALPDATFDPALACPELGSVTERFVDVGETHRDAVACLAWFGVARGTSATTYMPEAAVSRAQLASFVLRVLASIDAVTLPDPVPGEFIDVTGGVHAGAVETLAAFDPPLVRGFADGRFRPDQPVTRAQAATILAGMLDEIADQVPGVDPLPTDAVPPTDAADSVHAQAVARLYAAGVITGYPDGTFRPGRSVSREQTASLLARTLGGVVSTGALAPAPPVPDLQVALRLTTVAAMGSPTAGAVGPDGVVYLAERRGTVHPLLGSGVGPAVLDLSADVGTTGEGGLLGLAFASDGSEVYVSYTDTSGDTALDAVAVEGGTIRPEQRRTVFTLDQPASNHNGGDVKVGPDGMLYLALGDGGGAFDPLGAGQDLTTPLGALLRIDPRASHTYAVPDDNPFVGWPGVSEEIWAYGLRNPWRFSFDHHTGDLWIGDVGQNLREEVNRVPAGEGGANLGWSVMEGTVLLGSAEPEDHLPPVHEYVRRGPEGCAVTGGFVYRGAAIPALRGAYLYSDYCVSSVRGLAVDGAGLLATWAELGIGGSSIVSFVEDADGELYVLELGGAVKRIDPA